MLQDPQQRSPIGEGSLGSRPVVLACVRLRVRVPSSHQAARLEAHGAQVSSGLGDVAGVGLSK